VTTLSPLLDVLADVPDPRRAEGKLYKLPYVLLFFRNPLCKVTLLFCLQDLLPGDLAVA